MTEKPRSRRGQPSKGAARRAAPEDAAASKAAARDGASPGPGPEGAARDLLVPLLDAMIRAVRAATARVVSSGRKRRAAEASAEDPGGDAEAVHDFRVALRRLRTVVRIVRDMHGRKRMRKIGEDLKRYADATGALRDEEVLRETLTALEVTPRTRQALAQWMERRRRQELSRRSGVVTLLREDGSAPRALVRPPMPLQASLADTLARLEKRLARGGADVSALDLALASMSRARRDVREHAAATPADAEAMHTLRIRFKRLRYTAELFAPVLADAAAAVRGATKMQKRLGELHDLDEALLRVSRAWGLSPRHRATVLAALRAWRGRAAERARTDVAAEIGSWLPADPTRA